GVRDLAGQLDSERAASVRNLAAEEALLAEETDHLRPRLSSAAVFGLALEGAVDARRRASGILQRGETGAAAKQTEQIALSLLEQILEALRPDVPSATSQPAGQEQQPPPSRPDNLAGMTTELKLLRLLQEQITKR